MVAQLRGPGSLVRRSAGRDGCHRAGIDEPRGGQRSRPAPRGRGRSWSGGASGVSSSNQRGLSSPSPTSRRRLPPPVPRHAFLSQCLPPPAPSSSIPTGAEAAVAHRRRDRRPHHWPDQSTRPIISSRSSASEAAATARPVRSTTWLSASAATRRLQGSSWPRSRVPSASRSPRNRDPRPRWSLRPVRSPGCGVGDPDLPGRLTAGGKKIPRPSSTSWALRTGPGPSYSSWLLPALAELCTGPGTTRTSMPRAMAASAVIRLPPAACDSTTTTMDARAAMTRLRAGNRQAWAGRPGRVSDSMTPARTTCSHNSA